MKPLLCLLLCCILVEGRRKILRDDNCLTRNSYMHESYCRHKPQRIFYVFHRVISDCVLVTTRCPKMHRHNEYASISECRDDCWWFIENEGIPPTTPRSKPKSKTDEDKNKEIIKDKDKDKDKDIGFGLMPPKRGE